MSQTEGGRVYGWGWGPFLLQLFSLMTFAVAVPILAIMALDVPQGLSGLGIDEYDLLLNFSIVMLWLSLCLAVLSLILQILNLFTTRIVVSPDGIEYRSWQYHQRARWSDIERIGIRVTFGFASEVLYLRRSELTGGRPWLAWRRMLGLPPTIMFLSGMFGWPEGPLADDIRRYAPHLFAAPALTN